MLDELKKAVSIKVTLDGTTHEMPWWGAWITAVCLAILLVRGIAA